MIKKNILIFTFVSLISCTNVDNNINANNFENNEKNYYFLKALNSYQKNDKDSAMRNFLIAESIEPNNAMILREIAYFYADLGNIEKSKEYYKKSLNIDPHDTKTLKNMLLISLQENNMNEAKNYLESFIDKNSEDYLISKIYFLIINNDEENIKNYLDKLLISDRFYNYHVDNKILKLINKYYSNDEKLKIYENLYLNQKTNIDVVINYAISLNKNNKKDLAYSVLKNNLAFNNNHKEIKQILEQLLNFYEEDNNSKEILKLKNLIKKYN